MASAPRPPTLIAWIAAARPGFLLVTLVAATTGVAQALACGAAWRPGLAIVTVVLALLAHAAANLYNDYGDALGGSDAINTQRLTPFSGGSRVVQDGLFSAAQMRTAAKRLAIVVVGGGLVLTAFSGPGLLVIGLVGIVLGWAYSSPRIALMGRGLGEAAVAASWWLVVVGADYVLRGHIDPLPALSGVSLALLVTGILWAAEFPDAPADAAAGKRTLVVRWGARPAAWAYAGIVVAAHAWLLAWWWADWLPTTAVWALVSAPASLTSAALLIGRATDPARLRPVIALAIAAAVLHGAALTAAYAAIARLR